MNPTKSLLPAYRVYYLNREGRIVAVEPIPANDDEAARAFAAALSADQQKELWERGRRIAVYPRPDAAIEVVI